MSLSTSAQTAFQTAAGVSPATLSVLVRTLLLSLTFLWAAWCIQGEIHYFRHHGVEAFDVLRKFSRLLIVVVFMVSLVFIA